MLLWEISSCLLIRAAVDGHYAANVLPAQSARSFTAHLETPYMDTTDMCLELYYQLKSTAIVLHKQFIGLRVFVVTEDKVKSHELASSVTVNQTSWVRMFAKLPDGFHQIVIVGTTSETYFSDISVDDVVVQACDRFG